MSVSNVTPINPDTYTVTVQHKPSSPDDTLPWLARVEQGERYVNSGWSGTRDDAIEKARWIIAADNATDMAETLTMTADGGIV